MCGSTYSDAYDHDYDYLDEDCQQSFDCRGELGIMIWYKLASS